MKHFFIALAILSSGFVMGQENEMTDSQERLNDFTAIKKHELSLDVGSALAIPALSPRYEYILGRYSGVGVDLFISLDNDSFTYNEMEKFGLTPYYRQYFFSKEDYGAKGFYGEGFVKFLLYEGYEPDARSSDDTTNFFETAIGVGIGWKWVSNSGFLIDVGFGLGRDLNITSDEFDDIDLRLRGGVNFGWRF